MKKEDVCQRILDEMEQWRPSNSNCRWVDEMDKETIEGVIGVMQNVVKGVMLAYGHRRYKVDWYARAKFDECNRERWPLILRKR